MVERLAAPAGKRSRTLLSAAEGAPPFQLLGFDQRLLTNPVQVWMAGVCRSSRPSSLGWKEDGRLVWPGRRNQEDIRQASGRNQWRGYMRRFPWIGELPK